MAFIGGETSFYVVRVLLGIAEAGFFPGIIFYLTLWFPAVYRARIIGYFMAAIPLSTVIGAPVSGLLLGLDGLHGHEGLAVAVHPGSGAGSDPVRGRLLLSDRPARRRDVAGAGGAGLAGGPPRAGARQQRDTVRRYSVTEALLNPKVLALSVVYFGAVATNYGLSFFLPQIVKAFGVSNFQAGLVSALPYVVGTGRHRVVGTPFRPQAASAASTSRSRCSWRPPGSRFPPRSTTRR